MKVKFSQDLVEFNRDLKLFFGEDFVAEDWARFSFGNVFVILN